MKNLAFVCIAMLVLNTTGLNNDQKYLNTPADTCSLDVKPRLQAYCLKKTRKEQFRYNAPSNTIVQAINNSLHFIGDGFLNQIIPLLK